MLFSIPPLPKFREEPERRRTHYLTKRRRLNLKRWDIGTHAAPGARLNDTPRRQRSIIVRGVLAGAEFLRRKACSIRPGTRCAHCGMGSGYRPQQTSTFLCKRFRVQETSIDKSSSQGMINNTSCAFQWQKKFFEKRKRPLLLDIGEKAESVILTTSSCIPLVDRRHLGSKFFSHPKDRRH